MATSSTMPGFSTEAQILGTLYGNCIGDAIGLLTEFMTKREALKYYEEPDQLEYEQKVPDMHRCRWETGDWTDDSDQMILIMLSLLNNEGKVDHVDFANRLKKWARQGFSELGDFGGMGIGATTSYVLKHEKYEREPHEAAKAIWEFTDKKAAPNGAVMRTSILGIHDYKDMEKVIENTLNICKVVHYDPRCQASCVAVTSAIAFMLQRNPQHLKKDGTYNVKAIQDDSFQLACKCLDSKEHEAELKHHMYATKLSALKLDEDGKIGYTLKCMGSGFWALQQNDFRKALQKIVMEAGDADTNGAVAGAMLGCKLGLDALPQGWLQGLRHKAWLDSHIQKFLTQIMKIESTIITEERIKERTAHETERNEREDKEREEAREKRKEEMRKRKAAGEPEFPRGEESSDEEKEASRKHKCRLM